MSPNTDLTHATAATLAIIQGKESLSSMIDELDSAMFEQVYNQADKLNRSNVIAMKSADGYIIQEHAKMWTRRVR